MRRLREMGVVFAFRRSYVNGGTSETRFALGYVGKRLICAQRAQTPPAPKAYAQSLERLVVWPKLNHQLGVNDFFCGLAAHRNPARRSKFDVTGGVLTQWWSEKRCAEFFCIYSGNEVRLRPDGYGCWERQGRVVRFFLEHDTGTESLTVVTGKIADYSAFSTDRFGILLFSVHSSRREHSLRAALSRAQAGYDPGFVIATAARDHDHPDGPAGPVWGIWDPRDSTAPVRRYRLDELPERGPRLDRKLSRPDEPLSEAAFDPDDQQMVNLIHRSPGTSDTRNTNNYWRD
nr:replication-relaxation family protein [Kibdelosporangium phytohabitans]